MGDDKKKCLDIFALINYMHLPELKRFTEIIIAEPVLLWNITMGNWHAVF